MKHIIGVDVGGTTIKFGAFLEAGTRLEKWEIATRTEGRKEKLYNDIASSIHEYLHMEGMTWKDLAGIGGGIPGPVLPNGNIRALVNLGLHDLNIDKELPPYVGNAKVRAVNDANAAALGEIWQGSGKDYENMVLLTLGTGVGCGVIEGGHLITGSFGMGGELGHILVNPNETAACNCGGHGCLEQYASATGVARMAEKKLAESDAPSALRGCEFFTCKDVFDAAREGDALAKDTVDECMYYLGLAMSYVSHMTDPQCFVIGGGVSKAGRYLLDVLRGKYEQFFHIQEPQADIRLAELGNDAGIYGAARMILE